MKTTTTAKPKLPRSTSPRIDRMFSSDDVTLEDLRARRDLAVRDGDLSLAMKCATAIDRKRGLY